MAMASCARVPYICMVRAEELRKEEVQQLKEEVKEVIAEIKEEVVEIKEEVVEEEMVEDEEEDEEEGVVIDLMFESAVLKARVMELELERTYLKHKLAVAKRRRIKRLNTRRCAYCKN